MKIMSRDFTRTEKILIAVLALILLGLFYYQFVEKTVRQSITNAQSEAQMLQTELDAAQARLMAANNIKNSMDALEASGQKSWMGSYNNSRAEVAFLNTILADTLQYSVTFSNVTRAGNQIRRSFTLEYRTGSYAFVPLRAYVRRCRSYGRFGIIHGLLRVINIRMDRYLCPAIFQGLEHDYGLTCHRGSIRL